MWGNTKTDGLRVYVHGDNAVDTTNRVRRSKPFSDETDCADMNVFHSHDSPEWYTPTSVIERARRTMGAIDLDPFSHAEANLLVKACNYYTVQTNGLKQPWQGATFVNPPGGLVCEAWVKLLAESPPEWFWVGFSVEQLQSLQSAGAGRDFAHPLDFPVCIPSRRIAYVENVAKRRARVKKLLAQGKAPNRQSSPSHSSYLVYGGKRTQQFRVEFESLGYVKL